MYNHILFISYWVVNSFLLYLASRVLPESYALGTWKFTQFEAAIYAGFWLTFFVWSMWDFILTKGLKLTDGLSTILYFWGVNSLGIWLVARFSQITGFGISAFYWALYLGLVTDLVQRIARNIVVNPKIR